MNVQTSRCIMFNPKLNEYLEILMCAYDVKHRDINCCITKIDEYLDIVIFNVLS